ncbi:unnamed protein product, partial [Closterium sp. NIES-53]
IHGSKDSIKFKVKESYTSPRQVSPAGDLHGLRELLAPRVRQAAKAALGAVGTPTLLSSAVASAENGWRRRENAAAAAAAAGADRLQCCSAATLHSYHLRHPRLRLHRHHLRHLRYHRHRCHHPRPRCRH